jgi:hypothetical protein
MESKFKVAGLVFVDWDLITVIYASLNMLTRKLLANNVLNITCLSRGDVAASAFNACRAMSAIRKFSF